MLQIWLKYVSRIHWIQKGTDFIQQMRRAAKDNKFLQWAIHAVDSSSLPLSGYVWEESGSIVGNISVIPFRNKGMKVYLLANVAVHPDFRRRNIATNLTEIALEHARKRKASDIWLQVRDDNPAAINLYRNFGFQEIARRTRWQANPDKNILVGIRLSDINYRKTDNWPVQKKWLQRIYPEKLTWYQPMDWFRFRPGLLPSIYRFFSESETHHWTISDQSGLQAVVTWFADLRRYEQIWAAIPEGIEPSGLTDLLLYVRRKLAGRKTLIMDFPGGVATEAIQKAGFSEVRTLIWMRLDATSHDIIRK